MGDVDDVEHPEGDRHPDRDRRIEPAEQQPRDQRVAQQVKREVHALSAAARHFTVMLALVASIHAFLATKKGVDARPSPSMTVECAHVLSSYLFRHSGLRFSAKARGPST